MDTQPKPSNDTSEPEELTEEELNDVAGGRRLNPQPLPPLRR